MAAADPLSTLPLLTRAASKQLCRLSESKLLSTDTAAASTDTDTHGSSRSTLHTAVEVEWLDADCSTLDCRLSTPPPPPPTPTHMAPRVLHCFATHSMRRGSDFHRFMKGMPADLRMELGDWKKPAVEGAYRACDFRRKMMAAKGAQI